MKVFPVEDSPLLRERLEALLAAIPGVRTVGHAAEAAPAIDAILATGAGAVVLELQDKTNDIARLREALAAREHGSHRQAE